MTSPVGGRFRYSDINFIVLGELIRALTGQPLDQFAKATIFEPLGMQETGFNPPEGLKLRAAPTEQRDGQWLKGTVHDPRSFALNGVAGHAGLFSTANDLAVFAQMMLGCGELRVEGRDPIRVLSPLAVTTMTRGYRVSAGLRGLGWDSRSDYSSNRGDLLSDQAFGHGGFTGTVLWIDPKLDLFFIFLSNRVHPDGRGNVNALAGQISNVIASSILTPSETAAPSPQAVLTGIDVLQRDHFRGLANQRVALITNQTGRDRDGKSTAEILRRR